MACGGHVNDTLSEESYDFNCSACDRENKTLEAVKYCIQCRGYCCQSCTDLHNKFPTLMNHNFLDVSQGIHSGNQPARLPEFPTERCNIHSGKVMDLYCKCHDSVGCVTCMALDHKSCPGKHIYSIPDMLNILFNLSESQQTQDHLRQMMVCLTTLDKSKDALLKTLKTAKKEAIQQIEIFQNALHAILRKAAESSRHEVEEAYNNLENEILQDKQSLYNTNVVLQDTDKKLSKTVANRAQRFVSTNVAKKNIKEAEKIKQKMDAQKDTQLLFRPNQPLMKYIKDLQDIGNVQVLKKKKHDLYKLRESKDINVKVTSDAIDCWSPGCCITNTNKLIVTDYANKKLKHVHMQAMTVVEALKLDSHPVGVCCVNDQEVAITCNSPNKIQFVSVQDKMIPTRHIDVVYTCIGIATKNDKLYVTSQISSLHVYDMTGTMLKIIATDNCGNKLFTKGKHISINESGTKIVVADLNNGLVCFDGEGNYISTVNGNLFGVCFDNRGNVFVTDSASHNVVQYTEDGQKVGTVVKGRDGLKLPVSVSYHPGLNRLFVTQWKSNVMKMYELE
ncbi:hypothetical protein ACF0H5_010773 [Mactra antiquata]